MEVRARRLFAAPGILAGSRAGRAGRGWAVRWGRGGKGGTVAWSWGLCPGCGRKGRRAPGGGCGGHTAEPVRRGDGTAPLRTLRSLRHRGVIGGVCGGSQSRGVGGKQGPPVGRRRRAAGLRAGRGTVARERRQDPCPGRSLTAQFARILSPDDQGPPLPPKRPFPTELGLYVYKALKCAFTRSYRGGLDALGTERAPH